MANYRKPAPVFVKQRLKSTAGAIPGAEAHSFGNSRAAPMLWNRLLEEGRIEVAPGRGLAAAAN